MEDLDYWNSGTLVHSTSAFLMIRKTSVEILVNPISSVPYPLVDLVLVFAGPYDALQGSEEFEYHAITWPLIPIFMHFFESTWVL